MSNSELDNIPLSILKLALAIKTTKEDLEIGECQIQKIYGKDF